MFVGDRRGSPYRVGRGTEDGGREIGWSTYTNPYADVDIYIYIYACEYIFTCVFEYMHYLQIHVSRC